jgi:hypothetical protein
VKFLFGSVACSEFEFWILAYHPVTLRICPGAPVAPPGHERCNGRWETVPPSCKLICVYFFIVACLFLHTKESVSIFVLRCCATLRVALFCPQLRETGKSAFMPCLYAYRSCRSYCYIVCLIICCASCKCSLLFV